MSVTAPAGFVAAGIACGIKPAGTPDLALVATDDARPVPVAAVFTSNRAAAAPVQASRAHLRATRSRAAAVVINSGNANAATGEAGRRDAHRTCALVAARLGCDGTEVLVCSTGLIGIPLPMQPIENGIGSLVEARGPGAEAAAAAATAILTTDTHRKEVVVEGDSYVVGGMAKGAAMLAPNMATMLAVLTTDASLEAELLQAALVRGVAGSFNALSVDGSTSTNDTVILLASGRTGVPADPRGFERSVAAACSSLAGQMAADAEGATKVVRVHVTGARDDEQAQRAARKVAESQLVKCSLYGADPYWGRVVSELGSAGVEFDPDLVSVAYGGTTVCAGGVAAAHDPVTVSAHLAGRHIDLTAGLGLGDGEGVVLTSDLTPGYIAENMTTS